MKWNLLFVITLMMISTTLCFGSCSQYMDKVNCTNSCACCWSAFRTGEYDEGIPIIAYQCSWNCINGYEYDNRFQPTVFCNIVNKTVLLVVGIVMVVIAFVAIVLGLALLGIIGIVGLSLIVLAFLVIMTLWEKYGAPLKNAYPRLFIMLSILICIFIIFSIICAILWIGVQIAHPIFSVLFS
jgi:hypothetical protein